MRERNKTKSNIRKLIICHDSGDEVAAKDQLKLRTIFKILRKYSRPKISRK